MDMHEELLGAGDRFRPIAAGDDLTSPDANTAQRRLLTREQAHAVLQLDDEKLQFLINTRQITSIRIVGEERIDSRDIDRLIDGYKGTASRRALE
jgi:hypothetical protein